MKLAHFGRSFEAKRRRRSLPSDPCTASARIDLAHRVLDDRKYIHLCSTSDARGISRSCKDRPTTGWRRSCRQLVQLFDSFKSLVIDPRPVAGLGQSWHRWSCEFPGQMNHNDTREHTEDVVTSQQNELLHVQFRRECCCVNEKAPFRVASQMSPKSMHVPETDASKRQWSDGASTVD